MRLPDLPGYHYEGFLGEDPFGWTFVALHEDGKRRSVRVFKSQATSDRFLQSYFKIFSDPQGAVPGVSRVHDFQLQNPHRLAACATPFYGWKARDSEGWQVASLERIASLLSREQILEVIRETGVVLGGVHSAKLFHGGLRPSGIFLSGDAKGGQKVRLGEFGQIFMGGLQFLEAGDLLFYTSPEQLSTGDFSNGRGFAWDVYAFGVIAFELLSGALPRLERLRRQKREHPDWFEGAPAITFGELSEVAEYYIAQLEADAEVRWPGAVSDPREIALREVIGRCLRFQPGERPASMIEVAAEVSAALQAVPEKRETRIEADRTPFAPAIPLPATAPEPRPKRKRREAPAPSLFDDSATLGDSKAGVRPSKGSFSKRFRESPVFRWQLTTVFSLVAILPITWFAVYNFLKAREKANEAEEEITFHLKEQENVKSQALAYQRDFLRTRETAEQLKSELNEAEDSKNNLLGQAKLARQLLRQTQENGDRFFRLVLENRDTDVPEFRERRAAALAEGRKHYERLVEAYGDAPDFIVSTANALFHLGQIYREMGEFGKALASFGEAERRYTALLEDSATADVEFVKNIAASKSALGELAVRSGQYSTARHYFTESSRFWSEARSRDPALSASAALFIHENSLAIVECEFAMDRLDAALDAAMSVGVTLTELQKKSPDDHRVTGALAKSFSLAGRVLEARGEAELAKEAYQQSSDLFARAVSLDAAVDAYQLGLGNSLARLGLLANDNEKLESAAEVLSRVVAANPFETIYLKTLADIFGTLATNQRDGGNPKNAIALEEKAIAILKPIVEKNAAVAPDVRYSYAQRLAHLAELLGDSGRFDDSREPLQQAVALLEEIASVEGASSQYRRTLARTLGMAGFACLQAGDETGAREHLELARTEWESYMEANPEDNDAAQAVKWTSEQLKRLP